MRESPRLVVRPERPFRRRLRLLAAPAVVAALVLAYFAGVYWGAPAHLRAAEAGRLQKALAVQSAADDKLQARVAFLEQSLVLANQSEAATRKSLSEEQAKQVALRQKLAFYEGILNQGGDQSPVKIAGLQIIPTGNAHEYRFQIVLVRTRGRAAKPLSGTCELTISGERGGRDARLSLADLTSGGADPIKFRLRYFSNLAGTLTLPAGFTPDKLEIAVKTDGAAEMTGSYSWPAFRG